MMPPVEYQNGNSIGRNGIEIGDWNGLYKFKITTANSADDNTSPGGSLMRRPHYGQG